MEFVIERVYEYLALKHIKGLSDTVIRSILEKRGTISGIFNEKSDFFYGSGVQAGIAEKIYYKSFNEQAVESIIKRVESLNISIVTIEDADYPKLLKEIYAPPAVLFVKGSVDCLNNICVGIVGSRSCSKQAETFTYKLAGDLSAVGITVVSGFAYGIDIAAHLGACKKGATACVLGSGLANIYPKNHIKYINSIIEQGGCIVSEFMPDEAPLPNNFPRRNRIISGLSKVIAVIEAGQKSGSLITCRFAVEQNRDIFAVPAFPTSKNNASNSLLKEGAKFLETSLDIIKELQYDLKIELENEELETNNIFKGSDITIEDEDSKKIYNALSIEPLSLNGLCMKLDMDIVTAMSSIAELEINGIIEKAVDEKYNIIK